MSVGTLPARRHAPPVWVRWVVVALWMAFIFYMSAQANSGDQSHALARAVLEKLRLHPTPTQAEEFHHLLRKTAHFTEYGVLAALMAWAQPGLTRGRAALTWLGAALYACTDEFHQSFVPTRGPAIADVLIDSSGALVALLLWMLVRRPR
jgi:VanZ family protein